MSTSDLAAEILKFGRELLVRVWPSKAEAPPPQADPTSIAQDMSASAAASREGKLAAHRTPRCARCDVVASVDSNYVYEGFIGTAVSCPRCGLRVWTIRGNDHAGTSIQKSISRFNAVSASKKELETKHE